jgi:hypothetical protein
LLHGEPAIGDSLERAVALQAPSTASMYALGLLYGQKLPLEYRTP